MPVLSAHHEGALGAESHLAARLPDADKSRSRGPKDNGKSAVRSPMMRTPACVGVPPQAPEAPEP
jgi:hypothetical protein